MNYSLDINYYKVYDLVPFSINNNSTTDCEPKGIDNELPVATDMIISKVSDNKTMGRKPRTMN